jgi:MFS family permease
MLFALLCFGIQAAFFGPIKYSILPEMTKDGAGLVRANALVQASTFIAILTGTIAGGLLVLPELGESRVAVLLTSLAVLNVVLAFLMPAAPAATPALSIAWNFAAETWRIVRSAAAQPSVRTAIIGISWFWFAGAIYLSQFPTYVKDTLNAAPQIVTFFLALFSIGIALGSLISSRLIRGTVTLIYVPIAACGMTLLSSLVFIASFFASKPVTQIAFSDFALSPYGLLISALLLGLAICGGLISVPFYTLMQAESRPDERARMVGANNILNALAMVLSSVMCAGLVHIIKPEGLFLVAGISAALPALITLLSYRRMSKGA